MSQGKFFMDTIYQVGEEGEAPITVIPDPVNPYEFIRIHAASEKDKEYWGNVNFIIHRDMARLLGEALIKASKGNE